MVGNEDHPFREVGQKISVCSPQELASDTLMPAYSDNGRGPALCHASGQESP